MTRMNRVVLSLTALLIVVPTLWAGTVTITSAGWTISADESLAQLTISTDKLGVVLQNVRPNFRSQEGLIAASELTAEVTAENQLSIRTRDSLIVWVFELHPNELRISSTSSESVLTGQAPASFQ